jgi:integrase
MPDALTDATIKKAIKGASQRFEMGDGKATGLRLRVSPGGHAVWVLAVKDRQGAARRFKLGEYPTLGLAAARTEAHKLKAEVTKGRDPVEEARQRRAWGVDAKHGIGTLGAMLVAYGKTEKGTKKSWSMADYRIRHVFARHVDQPLGTLTKGALQATAQAHKGPYAAAAAVRALRPVLKWAEQVHQLGSSLYDLTPPASPKQRDHVISVKDLPNLVPVLRVGGPHERAMLFMLLTLARREEVGGAKWAEIDLKRAEWVIPAKRAKNAKAHTVPLSRQAVALLGAEGDSDAFVFATATGGRLGNWGRAAAKVIKDTGVKGWTRHDLRRTGATMLGEAGVEPHVIEAALNHVALHSVLAANYNKARYRPAVKIALQALADKLDGIVEEATAPGAAEGTGAGTVPSGGGADVGAGQAGEVSIQAGEVHEG